MTTQSNVQIIPLEGIGTPEINEGAWVAPGAVIVGNVTLQAGVSVWYNSVLRSDYSASIEIGENSNVQDNVSCHVGMSAPLVVGRGVSVGHGAVLHGCIIGDDVLIGMGATVLNGATVGSGSLVAAGAVVLEGTVVPEHSLVAGVPARVVRELRTDEADRIRSNASEYVRLARIHGAQAVE